MFRETSSWEGGSVLYRNVQNTVLYQIRPQAPGRNNPSLIHSKIYKMHVNSNYENSENMNRLIEKKQQDIRFEKTFFTFVHFIIQFFMGQMSNSVSAYSISLQFVLLQFMKYLAVS